MLQVLDNSGWVSVLLAKEEGTIGEYGLGGDSERRDCRWRTAIHNCSIMCVGNKFTCHISN